MSQLQLVVLSSQPLFPAQEQLETNEPSTKGKKSLLALTKQELASPIIFFFFFQLIILSVLSFLIW